MRTTLWLLANNEEICADMPRGSMGCVDTLLFSRMLDTLYAVPMLSSECSSNRLSEVPFIITPVIHFIDHDEQ